MLNWSNKNLNISKFLVRFIEQFLKTILYYPHWSYINVRYQVTFSSYSIVIKLYLVNIILLELTFDMVIILLLVKFTFLITESQCILHLLSIKQIQISPKFPYSNSLEKITSIWFQFCNIIDLYRMKILCLEKMLPV